jgi:2-(3-amino-3-carboxypropyl)histidine synthase
MNDVIKKLRDAKAKKIFVQYPEGIKLRIQEIVKELEKEGFDVVLCIEPCFGACDIRDDEAGLLGCDTILHIGHEDFGVKSALPIVFWEYFLEVDPLPVLEKEFEKLKDYKDIGLITSIQFVKLVPKVGEFLKKKGKNVFTYKSLQYPGQILGCRLEAAKNIEAKIDCFLCISAGKFYGWGLTISSPKPTLCLDLETKKIYSLDDMKKRMSKIIAWNKSQFEDAKNVGVLVSWKKGQHKVLSIKAKLEEIGKTVYVLAMDEVTPEKLEGLKLDFLVNTACPRIGWDDFSKYRIPMLNYDELEFNLRNK